MQQCVFRLPYRPHPADGDALAKPVPAPQCDVLVDPTHRPHPLPSAASITARAMGAATCPPVASLPRLPPLSTTTATAILGSSAGAKHTNHAWGLPPGCCAVPVLPATRTPEIWAGVPVPAWTTVT